VQELVVIALVALFVLGPERLPVVMRAGGRLLTKVRNYGVTASKELRGVADLGGLSGLEQEVSDLRRELDRTRSDLRRAMRETMASSDPKPLRAHVPSETLPDEMLPGETLPGVTQDDAPDTRG
jgi:Sec-independent protein translocase protein TatA